jgi:hypothetical protein
VIARRDRTRARIVIAIDRAPIDVAAAIAARRRARSRSIGARSAKTSCRFLTFRALYA